MSVNTLKVDLRLLLVFSAIMEERSVSKAASRLGLTQSAVSNALNRLRSALEDRLFLPTSSGMIPTARALEMAGPLEDGLQLIASALERRAFDPGGDWTFNLALSDQASTVILPRLFGVISKCAPRIKLHVGTKRNALVREQLDGGHVDIAVGIIPDLGEQYSSCVLLEDYYVCTMRRDHWAASSPLTQEAFSRAEHLALRSTEKRSGRMDAMVSEWGVSRNVMLTVKQLTAVPGILMSTELVACLPYSLAVILASPKLRIVPLQFQRDPVKVVAAWSASRSNQPALKWMRDRLIEVCAGYPAQPSASSRLVLQDNAT